MGTASYNYDALDNLTANTITAGATARSIVLNFPDPATNRLMSTSGTAGYNFSYAYDSQGNIVQRGGLQYTFDQANRLTSASGVATYSYDGLGRRVSVVGTDGVNRVQVYSQGGQILQAGPSGGSATRYIYLNNHVLAEVSSAGTQYQHTDGLGSPVARSDSAGNLISQTKFEPYGNTAQGATPTLGFTGHVNDAGTGLVYMQQRYYDPVAGRFLSIDPVTTDADTGSSFNRYAYANNSPYKYIDPDGRVGQLTWTARDQVTYTVKYSISGASLRFTAAEINSKIANDFSGRVTVNGVSVTVSAQAVQVPACGPGINMIEVVANTAGVTSSGRSETNRIGGDQITLGATGANAATLPTVSHELGGHAGGAGDQYNGGVGANGRRLSADVPGPAYVVKDLSGQKANAQSLGEIVRAPTNTNSCANGVSAANGGC